MARLDVLFTGHGDIASHITRLLRIAIELRRLRPQAILAFASSGAYARMATDAGFEVVPSVQIRRDLLLHAQRQPGSADIALLLRQLRSALRSDGEQIRLLRPRLVVADGRPTVPAVCATLGIPCASVTSAVWVQDLVASTSLDTSALSFSARTFQQLIAIAAARTEFAACAAIQSPFDGDIVLAPDLPGLFGRPASDERFCGPLAWRGGTETLWPSGRGPRAYVSEGSTTSGRDIATLASLLARRGWRVVLTGSRAPQLGSNPAPRLHAVAFADAPLLLRDADIAVTHGGSGTTYQALSMGVPCLMLPSNVEQRAYSQLVVDARAGSTLCAADSDYVAQAEQLLQDTDKHRHANELGREALLLESEHRAVKRIARFIQER